MNRKTAFKILGIREGASRVQAKKAFRRLAKQYHPDRFAGDRALAEVRMDQMKQINQAFAFLVPLLPDPPPDEGPQRESRDSPPFPQAKRGQAGVSFSDLLGMVGKGVRSFFQRRSGSGQRASATPLPSRRQKQRQGPFPGQAPRFETILNRLHPGSLPAVGRVGKRGRELPAPPLSNFIKYMALKKKIDARTQRHHLQESGRVEKIGPISRVTPFGQE